MSYFIVKALVTGVIVALIAELSRRHELLAAALASLPLVSILAFVWIYLESRDTGKLIGLSHDIFWLVLPSLAFFLLFPTLLKYNIDFWWALPLACLGMLLVYGLMLVLMKTLGG